MKPVINSVKFNDIVNELYLTNPKSVYSFLRLLLARLPHLPPLLIPPTVPTVPLPGNRLRSSADYLRSHFSVSQQKALRSRARDNLSELAEPHPFRSLTLPSALLSTPLTFLRLPPTFSLPLPLAQEKLPIPC